ncbi:hypothetical protein BU24DRAFT_21569 [Aaosphaeria arxii CBS 175.79]|uniref:Fungal N-terminal domain-containing protein n=1 Tax=Aaosphaeria arxii CBS 175.79 TaxID=1450172 RepID=A0A6A5Y7F5_9PLEO|nr:uncharacterized protein BU24DRAFT_21569 [Aaosphaeria arxii CBS 175.79]KAF2021492.1 hypothetical protein BU24DRAFT_21569 [Aaosphaeria arxii CBS 175.79]
MSFGFSIGDILMLSRIAYDLYTSISAGRKAASRDLRELEDVLFSLRCSLEHLGDVSKDVLARTATQHGGPDFKANLNRMIASCGTTLQELDDMTKKYREIGIDKDLPQGSINAAVKKTLDYRIQRMKVNWKKIRWDQEKQSLQSYREKLKTHTDAINLILTSMVWSNTTKAEESSNVNHNQTHSLLNKVLESPQFDASMLQMLKEIHNHITQPKPESHVEFAKKVPPTPGFGTASVKPKPSPWIAKPQFSFSPAIASPAMPSFGPAWAMGGGRTAGGPIGGGAMLAGFTGGSSNAVHANHFAGFAISPGPMVPFEQDVGDDEMGASVFAVESNIEEEGIPEPTDDIITYRGQPEIQEYRVMYSKMPRPAPPAPRAITPPQAPELDPSIVTLNQLRQVVAKKETEAFKKKHTKVAKPSFLTVAAPSIPQLNSGLQYLFQPASEIRTGRNKADAEWDHDVLRWMEGFNQFVRGGAKDPVVIDLLVALNKAMEQCSSRRKAMFYGAADRVDFMDHLDTLQDNTKSVRVMKEIEEFQDVRDDWEDERR